MRFAFTADQDALREAVADALAATCPPTRVREAWAARDDALRGSLAELGLLGINLPGEVGGLELGPVDWVQPLEVVGRHAAPVALVETLATNPVLATLGLSSLAGEVAAGEAFVTLAGPDGLALDADVAAHVVSVSREGTVRLTDRPALEPVRSVDGSQRLFRVREAGEVVAVDGRAVLDTAALAAAAQLLGLSRWMLDTAVEYAKARRQFGAPIGSFQAVQHRLVDALLGLRFAAPMVWRAAWALAEGEPDASLAVAEAKLHATEAADRVARQALQVHGAIGYAFEHDLHLWMKRAWVLGRRWGDPGACLDTVRAAVLSSPAPGAP
ncbi:MAG: acyl-CoA dehydrogenase family protein [Alphaproteobacteria bacterium]|nr:acyl-CoA dehydrogenase family protein [Alphaproteobacteria bacterium]